jgi:hypothetical protein
MTEAEWLACTDPQSMLESLRGKASDRNLRLFAVACCRRAWRLLGERGRQAVVTAERCADEEVAIAELDTALSMLQVPQDWAKAIVAGANKAARMAIYAVEGALKRDAAAGCRGAAKDAAGAIAWGDVGEARGASDAARWAPAWSATEAVERQAQAALARDLFGNPFRPASLDPAWLTWHDGTIPKLAQVIYEDRQLPAGHLDTSRLAILADALEDAGCTDTEILAHCRGPGPHVRGCWVVDLLLGKV